MADRFGFQFPKTILPEQWVLGGSVSLGVTGVATGSLPIWMSSISPTGAANPTGASIGMYTVSLTDSWNAAPSVKADIRCAPAAGLPGGTLNTLAVKVIAVDVAVKKQIVLQVIDVANSGTATTPTSGQALDLLLFLSNNSSL